MFICIHTNAQKDDVIPTQNTTQNSYTHTVT
jgi:hypothetical protein